ncbi:histone deacetylase hos1 [Savitreella phatthalungensis]
MTVAYVYSPELARAADRLPSNPYRSSVTHALVHAYGLLSSSCDSLQSHDNAQLTATILPSSATSRSQLISCFDPDFVDALLEDSDSEDDAGRNEIEAADQHSLLSLETLQQAQGAGSLPVEGAATASTSISRKRKRIALRRPPSDTDASDSDADDRTQADKYGLEDDCPRFKGLSKYVLEVCGGTLTAASALSPSATPQIDVAIALDGGRHHAGPSRAAGFCYANDIILAASCLRRDLVLAGRQNRRCMIIDLDLHHGDGTERAFARTDSVLTLSVHRYDRGFYPGTGAISSASNTGALKGKGSGYTINVPTKRGLSTASFGRVIDELVIQALERYNPAAIIVQCGVDGLAHDPHAEWNLSIADFSQAIAKIDAAAAALRCKRLYLGGGGYNTTLVARAYAYMVATLLGRQAQLPNDIPEHRLWEAYKDTGHQLAKDDRHGGMQDENLREGYLDRVISQVKSHIESLPQQSNEKVT